MPHLPFRPAAGVLAIVAAAVLAGCSTSPSGDKFYGVIRPYRIDIVQGNVVTQEMFAQIQPGLGRAQVREILGSPLLTDLFHADRWDYVFSIRRQGTEPQERRVTVYFKDNKVERFEGGDLPSERDFVASIDNRKPGKIPPLELTQEQLDKLPKPAPRPALPTNAPEGAARDYPTLEPIAP